MDVNTLNKAINCDALLMRNVLKVFLIQLVKVVFGGLVSAHYYKVMH